MFSVFTRRPTTFIAKCLTEARCSMLPFFLTHASKFFAFIFMACAGQHKMTGYHSADEVSSPVNAWKHLSTYSSIEIPPQNSATRTVVMALLKSVLKAVGWWLLPNMNLSFSCKNVKRCLVEPLVFDEEMSSSSGTGCDFPNGFCVVKEYLRILLQPLQLFQYTTCCIRKHYVLQAYMSTQANTTLIKQKDTNAVIN